MGTGGMRPSSLGTFKAIALGEKPEGKNSALVPAGDVNSMKHLLFLSPK